MDLQRSAALAFAEVTEKEVRAVGPETIKPVLYLLQCYDAEVQRASSAALGNLAVNRAQIPPLLLDLVLTSTSAENKLLIVRLNGLEPLIRQMLSPNVEVQCNAVGCITNLATQEENKTKIAKSTALVPLARLAMSKDIRVQRNATGALLNMTHNDENRQHLVSAGAIPVLVRLLRSPDVDVQYYCTTALSNLAVDAENRKKLSGMQPTVVQLLIRSMGSTSLRVQCQAALALRNLASDTQYQIDIVRFGVLPHLLRLLQTSFLPLVLSSAACVRNVSIHPHNESPIIEAGFLPTLIELLSHQDNEELQCHAISTLRNLAASNERNKAAIIAAGAVAKIQDLILHVTTAVQSEMTACVAVLALSEGLKPTLLNMGVCHVLLPLTASDSIEVQGNAAAGLGNLASNTEDYVAFMEVWQKPEGGMEAYLVRFLDSGDTTFQHIAVWTVLQLLEGGPEEMSALLKRSPKILSLVRQLAVDPSTSSFTDATETDQGGGEGEGDGDEGSSDVESSVTPSRSASDDQAAETEIAALAQRLQFLLEEAP